MSNEAPTDALRLVPCPFCGGDVINTRSQEMTKGPAYYWHKCETCGAESEGDYGEDVAVAAWNRRAAPASPLPGGGPYERWGILNHLGESWTPENFDTERQATAYLDGWKRDNPKMDLSRHKVIPVLVTMTAAPTGDAT